jgi:hypothetical protein
MRNCFFIILVAVAFCGGCGVVGVLTTESYSEKKIPAQLDFSDIAKAGPILVFVEPAHGSRTAADLSAKLRALIVNELVKRTKVETENIISPEKMEPLLDQMRDFSGNRPLELAKMASAVTVLYVLIEDYRLYAVSQDQYHKGWLAVRSVVFDAASSRPLWPQAPATGSFKAEVEFETDGFGAAQDRLIGAATHCIVRNFYDCKKSKYKINDERTNLSVDGVQNMGY